MKKHTLVCGLVLTAVLFAACGKKQDVDDASHESSMKPITISSVTEESDEELETSSDVQLPELDPDNRSYIKYNSAGEIVYRIDYDEAGHPVYEYDNQSGNELVYTYELKDEDGNDVLYKYNAGGDLVLKTQYYGRTLNVHVVTGYYNGTMMYETTYLENGETLSSRDANGELSNNEYDGNGHLVKSTEAGQGYDTYEYNVEGQLTGQKGYDENGELLYTVTHEYDENGNVTKESQNFVDGSENMEASYSYDDKGNVTEVRTDYGPNDYEKDVYVYDAAGRTIEYTFVSGTADGETEITRSQYEYDDRDNVVKETFYSMGKLLGEKTYTYIYDNSGKIIKKETYVNGELSDVENYGN